MSNTNEVRQVLMNELGLTRDSVRGMATDIVSAEVAKHVSKMIADGFIEKIVRKEVDRMASASRWDTESVRKLVSDAAGKAVQQQVFEALCRR